MGVRRGVSGKYRRSLGVGAKSPKIGDHGGGKRRGEVRAFPTSALRNALAIALRSTQALRSWERRRIRSRCCIANDLGPLAQRAPRSLLVALALRSLRPVFAQPHSCAKAKRKAHA